MSASINGSDVQTFLSATQGLGFVEGKLYRLFVTFTVILCLLASLSLFVVTADQKSVC